jgi:hypothetical protein
MGPVPLAASPPVVTPSDDHGRSDRLAGAEGGRQPWMRLPHDVGCAVVETFSGGYVGVSTGTT